ncbi:MAG: bifunctional 5,10-methylenetetrahydrofolate dehydrogenase/5,10-methenyltetrahydrofolate cyclohydrolase [Firmicutes bacterium]|nr:bifunctional 5,10-methylenetetrahydrofolate dehydrogenase/5,10-methenyltetrahydrofolate cyclohydrolase [Bacillota bacterium]
MAELLKGAAVAAAVTERLQPEVAALKARGVEPCLALVRVGERPDDVYYEKSAVKRCEKVGVTARRFTLPEHASTDEVLQVIEKINADPTIHGCLVFRPLPAGVDDAAVRGALAVEKDVDGVTDGSLAGVITGAGKGFPPCTAQACMEILDHYGVDPCGQRVTVLGRSLVVGRPLALLLLHRNATVTVCHSRTGRDDIRRLSREADIVCACLGRAEMVDESFLSEGQIVLDVGFNPLPDGSVAGDVHFAAAEKARAVTPVPGGVGAVTTSVLVKHTVAAAARQNGIAL